MSSDSAEVTKKRMREEGKAMNTVMSVFALRLPGDLRARLMADLEKANRQRKRRLTPSAFIRLLIEHGLKDVAAATSPHRVPKQTNHPTSNSPEAAKDQSKKTDASAAELQVRVTAALQERKLSLEAVTKEICGPRGGEGPEAQQRNVTRRAFKILYTEGRLPLGQAGEELQGKIESWLKSSVSQEAAEIRQR